MIRSGHYAEWFDVFRRRGEDSGVRVDATDVIDVCRSTSTIRDVCAVDGRGITHLPQAKWVVLEHIILWLSRGDVQGVATPYQDPIQ